MRASLEAGASESCALTPVTPSHPPAADTCGRRHPLAQTRRGHGERTESRKVQWKNRRTRRGETGVGLGLIPFLWLSLMQAPLQPGKPSLTSQGLKRKTPALGRGPPPGPARRRTRGNGLQAGARVEVARGRWR